MSLLFVATMPVGFLTSAWAEQVPPLDRGLVGVLTFDDGMLATNTRGEAFPADFARDSEAWDVDLNHYECGQPRYAAGKFGRGLFLEFATKDLAGKNQLPGPVAGFVGGTIQGGVALAPPESEPGAAKFRVSAPGAKWRSADFDAPFTASHTFSLYLAGPEGGQAKVSVFADGNGQPVATKMVATSGTLSRVELPVKLVDKNRKTEPRPDERTPALRFEIEFPGIGEFSAAAPMLEANSGYSGRSSAGTWIPAGGVRAGEILCLPSACRATDQMTLALWVRPSGKVTRRMLLCIGNEGKERSELQIALVDESRLDIAAFGERLAIVPLAQPLGSTDWMHLGITLDGPQLTIFQNGAQVFSGSTKKPSDWKPARRITIGSTPSVNGTFLGSDSTYDEVALWDRVLAENEIARLARAESSLANPSLPAIVDHEPVRVFARDVWSRTWPVSFLHMPAPATVRYGVKGIFEREQKISADGKADLAWAPCDLEPGNYEFYVRAADREGAPAFETKIEIVPARIPADGGVQTITWSGYDDGLFSRGISTAGLFADNFGPDWESVEAATRNRLHVHLQAGIAGKSPFVEDRFVTCVGEPAQTDQQAPVARRGLEFQANRLADALRLFPDVLYFSPNSEKQSIWTFDFREATSEALGKSFGLDLSCWKGADTILPFGRLTPSGGRASKPANGIVPLDDPFYAANRWWQGAPVPTKASPPAPGTEVMQNDLISKIVRAKNPRVQSYWEPALRRPAVRVFREQSLLQEWFYYPQPSDAVEIQESLATAARGTGAGISGMPQFLLKPGVAAPYGGMPTPDMFRSTVWLCLSRPLNNLMYWNLWLALDRIHGYGGGNHCMTQEQIDGILGPKPTYARAAAGVNVKGIASSIFLWIPELSDAIAKLHNETVLPCRELFPAWKNRPRSIAVLNPFVGQLYGGLTWPDKDAALPRAVLAAGQPFDILWDQDFEAHPDVLAGYNVVFLSRAFALTRPAADQLRAFIARGGKVVADEDFGCDLDGVTVVKSPKQTGPGMAELERKLLRKYGRTDHPLYIEEMGQASRPAAGSTGIADAVAAARREVWSKAPSLIFNSLEAEGANYAVVVDDLRVAGRHYGHFGKVLEDAPGRTVPVEFAPSLGNCVYRIPEAQEMPVKAGGSTCSIEIPFARADGAILVFLPQKIERLTCNAPKRAAAGARVKIAAKLMGANSKPVPGIIPLECRIDYPDGSRHDYSGPGAFHSGTWTLDLPIAINAPKGNYKVTLRDLAAGRKATASFDVYEKP